jgi:NAD-dependent dihydropyrimidine dehydrogenase PreA subunit
MIEVVVADRCTGCGACVQACPSNVLALPHSGGPAVIARQEDCQTCYLCELHCPVDALYVAPSCDAVLGVTPAQAVASGHLGRFRLLSGWGANPEQYPDEHWRMGSVFERAFAMAAAKRA